MPVHSRRKGHSRERAIRKRWIECGWPDSKRGDQSRAGHEESDVCVAGRDIDLPWLSDGAGNYEPAPVAVPPFRCEVKDQKKLPGVGVLSAYRQAEKAATAGEIPMAIFHVARDDDYAFIRFGDLLRLASCGTSDGRARGASDQDVHTGEQEEVTNAASE